MIGTENLNNISLFLSGEKTDISKEESELLQKVKPLLSAVEKHPEDPYIRLENSRESDRRVIKKNSEVKIESLYEEMRSILAGIDIEEFKIFFNNAWIKFRNPLVNPRVFSGNLFS